MGKITQTSLNCFPALHSIIRGAELGQLVLHDFGLEASDHIRLIQSGFNDHYALRSGHEDFVIRVYRSGWRANEEIAWELDLVDHLASHGAPVAECVKCKDGRRFSELQAVEGARQVAVFRRAPGLYTHFGYAGRNRVSPADCAEQFGSSVAHIHAAANTYSSKLTRFQLDYRFLLDQPLKAIEQVYSHRERDVDRLRHLADELSQMLDHEGYPRLDWGPCHGDMSGGNSTYWNDRVIHFDFDFAGLGPRAYDLGVFFWSMSINGHGGDVWDRFMLGYSSRRSLSAADLLVIPVFAVIRIIWLMGLWCANAEVLGYHKLHDDYFDRESARLSDFHKEASRTIASGL